MAFLLRKKIFPPRCWDLLLSFIGARISEVFWKDKLTRLIHLRNNLFCVITFVVLWSDSDVGTNYLGTVVEAAERLKRVRVMLWSV